VSRYEIGLPFQIFPVKTFKNLYQLLSALFEMMEITIVILTLTYINEMHLLIFDSYKGLGEINCDDDHVNTTSPLPA